MKLLPKWTYVLLVLLLAPPGLLPAGAAGDRAAIEGIWYGTMEIPDGRQFRYVIEILPLVDGTLGATLINLDQGGGGIPATEFAFADGAVRLDLTTHGVVYDGLLREDGMTIDGRYLIPQTGTSFPLVLERVEEVPGFHRPQRLLRPYPYAEEEIAYTNPEAGIRIAGTLTAPRGTGPFPAVLLISGAGAQDRDEMLAYHRPFRVLADFLTRRGMAVLRVDDRGVGGSTGDHPTSTPEDFASDVLAGVDYLKRRADIDPDRIGLIGHSEGAMVAQMVAATSPDVAFTVLMGVECPVLAITGEKDLQVTPRENLPAIEEALNDGGNPDFAVMELPGLNHLFQTAATGAVSEYMQIEETLAPAALETIGDWIGDHAGLAPTATAVREDQTGALPHSLSLEQNFPNPFNSDTAIGFTLSKGTEVELAVYNLAGQKVATLAQGLRQAGIYSLRWDGQGDDGREQASGVYLYRLITGDRGVAQKLLLLR